jgi:hypothetical protein
MDRSAKHGRGRRPLRGRAGSRKPHRPWFEGLEDRTLLDSNLPSIVVGRRLSAYFAGDVRNSQETITYTVYNEQADTETGVLLTTTLESGVTLVSSSVMLDGTTTPQLPDQNGQELAWSLGTINGFDSQSVISSLVHPSALSISRPQRITTPPTLC